MNEEFRQKLIDLYKILIARSDITAAMDACDLMMREVKDFYEDYKHGKYTPILHAIIICYARPFTNNKPFGPLDKRWGEFNDQRHKRLHDDLITFRHKMIAHSDFSVRKVTIYPKNTEDLMKMKFADVNVVVSTKAVSLEYITEVRGLCFELGCRLNVEANIKLEDLFGHESVPAVPIDLGEILGLF